MTMLNKLAAAGLLAVAGLIAAPHASAACQTIKYVNKPVTISFLGFGIPAGDMTYTVGACWTPSTNKASPQLVNNSWFFLDSAPGNVIFGPGARVNQGASGQGGPVATSWGTVRFTIRAGATWKGIGLPAGQAVDVDARSRTDSQGFCVGSVAGVLVSQGACRSTM
jgi:hypothetical protein